MFLHYTFVFAQEDSLSKNHWIRNKIAFGRSQHIQYLGNNKIQKTYTLFNKSYYASFSPIQFKGFKPFVSLNYEYFFTKAPCYTCTEITLNETNQKELHFINFATLGIGFTQELTFKKRDGKEIQFIFGASIERFLFRRALINYSQDKLVKVTPFEHSNAFYNQYFFKDLYGVRVYQSNKYKVFIQLSGLLLRNERLFYAPSRSKFHNFMLGFNIYLK